MNIFLIPYTWLRHISMALWCAAWGLLAWWSVLMVFVKLSPGWHPALDGSILLSTLTGTIAFSSIAGESVLRRRSMLQSAWRIILATGMSAGLGMLAYWFSGEMLNRLMFSGQAGIDSVDASLVSLRYRVVAFGLAGLASGVGPLFLRKFEGWFNHLAGGLASGLAAAAVWHLYNFTDKGSDLFWAGAAMATTWGFVYGLLVWAIPDKLYAGWVRILSWNRYAWRIPVDGIEGGPKERFVGHFPRGLDMFLPVENEVAELHVSFAVDEEQHYTARGLSLAPTRVLRFLERINLRYDPRRPAPLQTRLNSGDRIQLGEGESAATVEFIMLPREER